MRHSDTAALVGWSDDSSDSDYEGGDTDEAPDSGSESASDEEQPRKKAKREDTVNTEGLKQQALTALRKVKMGLLAQADGITALESVCEDTPLNLLPDLLASTKTHFDVGGLVVKKEPSTPVKEEGKTSQDPSTPSTSGEKSGEATAVWVAASTYKCSECEAMFGSRNGCNSHINQMHTGIYHLCKFCDWSSPNVDSLKRHVRKSHKF